MILLRKWSTWRERGKGLNVDWFRIFGLRNPQLIRSSHLDLSFVPLLLSFSHLVSPQTLGFRSGLCERAVRVVLVDHCHPVVTDLSVFGSIRPLSSPYACYWETPTAWCSPHHASHSYVSCSVRCSNRDSFFGLITNPQEVFEVTDYSAERVTLWGPLLKASDSACCWLFHLNFFFFPFPFLLSLSTFQFLSAEMKTYLVYVSWSIFRFIMILTSSQCILRS